MNVLTVRKLFSSAKILFVLTFCILGCDGTATQQLDREAIKKEMEQREIRHILPAEIIEAAYKKGEELAREAQEISMETYPTGDEGASSGFIGQRAQAKIDSLAKTQNTDIQWVPANIDSAEVQLSELEKQLWEAYLYNVENNLPVNDNVQKINEDAYLYTRPMMLNPELRKKFFNSDNVSPDHGFLGMWSITLSKKEIIKGI